MKELQREILTQVAAGTITAEEGAARLEALDGAPAPAEAPETRVQPAGEAVRQVRVLSRFGNAEIIGDPGVTSAVVIEGPHRVRQEGDTMVIEQSPMIEDSSFEFSRPQGRVTINGFDFGRRLVVRMNPALPLVARVQAGNLRIEGLQAAITSEVQAGNSRVSGFRGPVNLAVTAGNVTANGRLDGGASAVRCEMGSVKLNLDRSSSVRITARATMGKVAIEGESIRSTGPGKDHKDVTVGSGAGTLDLECTMGDVKVAVE